VKPTTLVARGHSQRVFFEEQPRGIPARAPVEQHLGGRPGRLPQVLHEYEHSLAGG